jgi:hypothetical protein
MYDCKHMAAIGSLREAFNAAQARYPGEQWSSLPTKLQTAAIYKELRRLDAEFAEASDYTAPVPLLTGPQVADQSIAILRRARPPRAR